MAYGPGLWSWLTVLAYGLGLRSLLATHYPLEEVPRDTSLGFAVVSFIVVSFVMTGCAANELTSPIDLPTKGEARVKAQSV